MNMLKPPLEVIIPLKDRSTIQACVQSLLSADPDLLVTICDGGSSHLDCTMALQRLSAFNRVRLLQSPMIGFNKAQLLNYGLRNAIADYILISDADILWNADAIQQLLHCVGNGICSIQRVQETNPQAIALRRNRYTYRLSTTCNITKLEILPVLEPSSFHRPGCGLICASRSTLLQLGGYKEIFQGWGWEDQDLLIRAALLNISLHRKGTVTHISHSDVERNQYFDCLSVEETRNFNIIQSMQDLSKGKFLGSYSVFSPSSQAISIELPESLNAWKN